MDRDDNFCTDGGTHQFSRQARGAEDFAQEHFRRDVSMGEYLVPGWFISDTVLTGCCWTQDLQKDAEQCGMVFRPGPQEQPVVDFEHSWSWNVFGGER